MSFLFIIYIVRQSVCNALTLMSFLLMGLRYLKFSWFLRTMWLTIGIILTHLILFLINTSNNVYLSVLKLLLFY